MPKEFFRRQYQSVPRGLARRAHRPPYSFSGVARKQHRHRIFIHLAPSGLAFERRAQCPGVRQQRQVELVALQQLAPGFLARHQLAVVPPDGRAEEIAASVEEDALFGIQAVNQVVGPLVAGQDARHGSRRHE